MAILKRKSPSASRTVFVESAGVNSVSDLLSLAKRHGLGEYPIDVRGLIRALDIGLRAYPMEDQRSGYMKFEEGRWVIGVNSLHHPRRQRFTLAHELGHYFLHRYTVGDIEDTVLFRENGVGESIIEKQANEFAAELLMPESDFKASIRQFDGDIEAIAARFGVSTLAVQVRARQLQFRVS